MGILSRMRCHTRTDMCRIQYEEDSWLLVASTVRHSEPLPTWCLRRCWSRGTRRRMNSDTVLPSLLCITFTEFAYAFARSLAGGVLAFVRDNAGPDVGC